MSCDELKAFLDGWAVDNNKVKPLFVELIDYAQTMPGVELNYKGRPGVSHSVRLISKEQKDRPFFAVLDIIDDEPESRWISACFYAELVSDPEERGDVVPEGLEGDKDALCFDVEGDPGDFAEYLKERIAEGAKVK